MQAKNWETEPRSQFLKFVVQQKILSNPFAPQKVVKGPSFDWPISMTSWAIFFYENKPRAQFLKNIYLSKSQSKSSFKGWVFYRSPLSQLLSQKKFVKVAKIFWKISLSHQLSNHLCLHAKKAKLLDSLILQKFFFSFYLFVPLKCSNEFIYCFSNSIFKWIFLYSKIELCHACLLFSITSRPDNFVF